MQRCECVRILVVYFSRTGMTERVAQVIARALDADLEPIIDHTRRRGIIGYLRSAYQAAFGHLVAVEPATHNPWAYDLVVVGTPIWNQALSSPVRSYLERHEFHQVAFFCTAGARAGDRVFAQMTEAAGREPIATLVLRERDELAPAVEQFVAELRRVPVSRTPPAPPRAHA
jgi:flavodoxin